VLILKVVKVLCFDTLLQVLILKVVSWRPTGCRLVEDTTLEILTAAKNAAVAAVDEGEGTQRGTIVEAIGGHGSLQKEGLDFGFWGSLAEARRTSQQQESTRAMIAVSIKFFGTG
jgi:hypothetical protein